MEKENPDNEAIEFIWKSLVKDKGIKLEDLQHMDASDINEEIRSIIIEDTDSQLIAIGFGQILLTGFIDSETKGLIQIVIKRQLSDYVLEYWFYGDLYLIEERKSILQKELEVLEIL